MKTAILFYSYTGSAKGLAQQAAGTEHCDIIEIKDKHRPGTLKAYTMGCVRYTRESLGNRAD